MLSTRSTRLSARMRCTKSLRASRRSRDVTAPGLVTATREGRQVRYELADDRLAGALRELARVVLDSPACPAHLDPRP